MTTLALLFSYLLSCWVPGKDQHSTRGLVETVNDALVYFQVSLPISFSLITIITIIETKHMRDGSCS
jgi:hypothetical protein